MFDEFERAGLGGGGLGELVERGVGSGEADRVAGLGGEFGEQAAVAVSGSPVRAVFGLRFAVRGG